jgi:rhodanese-related sulfurtransferase
MSFDTIRANEINNYIGRRDVVIIDLRDREEYIAGHIPTAVNIPYEELEEQKAGLKQYHLLVFYCDRGHISLMAARDLIKDGYNIKSLYGGIRAYRGRLERG